VDVYITGKVRPEADVESIDHLIYWIFLGIAHTKIERITYIIRACMGHVLGISWMLFAW
jgi:hypothetical protein